jgi:hypothetical protein
VQLPDVGIPWIKAKLDTGAHTSALHAHKIKSFEQDGEEWVRFRVRPWQKSSEDETVVELPVHDRRRIRSSNGEVQERYVVKMHLILVREEFNVEVTLTNRDSMGFRMLIGRQALARGFDVTSSRSFLGDRAPRLVRRRNRGAEE